jgi:hypothetical protein
MRAARLGLRLRVRGRVRRIPDGTVTNRSRINPAVALVASTMLAMGTALTLGSGMAAAADGTAPQVQADALAKMMTSADIPSALKIDAGWEFTTKVDRQDLAFELCTKSGVTVRGVPAPVMHQVEFGETDRLADPISIQQNIWQFNSSAEAQRAWQVMQQRAKRCTGTTKEPSGVGGDYATQVLSNGTTRAVVNGRSGIWLHSVYASGTSDAGEGGYYVAFLLDDAIQTVEFDVAEGEVLASNDRWPVKKTAQALANRWLAGGQADAAT